MLSIMPDIISGILTLGNAGLAQPDARGSSLPRVRSGAAFSRSSIGPTAVSRPRIGIYEGQARVGFNAAERTPKQTRHERLIERLE
jgi:hypothetical protein